jgi:hypothetical protein
VTSQVTAAAYTAALDYLNRGWAVIPLHWVDNNGLCSCGSRDERHWKVAGKHPLSKRWQAGEAMSKADAYSVFMEQYPKANIGVLTGHDFWAMDVDPATGGMESLARMEAEHGPLPTTMRLRTGSGGYHYLWKMPPGITVKNDQHGKIAPGIDIRADRGMIVVAPSVSAKGAYTIDVDAPIVGEPAHLTAILRAAHEKRAQSASVEHMVVEDLPAVADLDDITAERVQRYAEKVVADEVERYRNAPPGTGNAELFSAACNVLEVAQSPWNLITRAQVHDALEDARVKRNATHPDRSRGGGTDRDEFEKSWQSAENRTVGRGRPLPADPNAGLGFDPGPEIMAALEAQAATREAVTGNRDPFGGDVAEDELSPLEKLRGALLTRDDLDSLPAAQPMIDGLLDYNSESWVIGASGSFKSFAALCMACHVALGMPDWRGQKITRQANSVYMVAEGAKSIRKRVQAWELTYGRRVENLDILPLPVQVTDRAYWDAFIELCVERKAEFIVIDTQARVTVGMDENDNGVMGVMINAVSRLKRATGACVLVVHHTGRNGGDARGASAIDGAQDVELRVERTSKVNKADLTATLSIDKSKDDSEEPAWNFEMVSVVTGVREDGSEIRSLALAPRDPFATAEPEVPKPWYDNLTENQTLIVAAMRDHGDANGHTTAEIRRWLRERADQKHGRALDDSSARSALRDLIKKELVTKLGKSWVLVEHLDEADDG